MLKNARRALANDERKRSTREHEIRERHNRYDEIRFALARVQACVQRQIDAI
jgi:hypothetical protein